MFIAQQLKPLTPPVGTVDFLLNEVLNAVATPAAVLAGTTPEPVNYEELYNLLPDHFTQLCLLS